jgi:hypothetical protein
MAHDDWRLRIELDSPEGLLERLGLADSDADDLAEDLRDNRLAVSKDGDTIFVYADSSLALERAHRLIDREVELLGIRGDIRVEHWLAAEDRWDDEPPAPDIDDEVLAEGYAPWEVRIPCETHDAARALADRLEQEGYGVVRRWRFVIAGCSSREQADELAKRLEGEVEPGGALVWETGRNPFALFLSGLGGSSTPL